MTAEEYLNSKKREHFYPGHTCYEVDLEAALKAVEMARVETLQETEKKYLDEKTKENIDFFKRASIAALQGIAANPNESMVSLSTDEVAKLAVEMAGDLFDYYVEGLSYF